jgi:hypothetical protein
MSRPAKTVNEFHSPPVTGLQKGETHSARNSGTLAALYEAVVIQFITAAMTTFCPTMFAFLSIPFKKLESQRICFDKSGQVTGQVTGQVATRSFSGSSSTVQYWRNPTNCSFTKRIHLLPSGYIV